MMDRNEAVQKLAKVARISVAYAEDLYDSFFPKPVVPQYVADWYEGDKGDLNGALFTMVRLWDEKAEIQTFIDGSEKIMKLSKPSSTCTSSAMRSRKENVTRFELKGLMDTLLTLNKT